MRTKLSENRIQVGTGPATFTEYEIDTYRETIKVMQDLAKETRDCAQFARMSLLEFYLYLRSLPYIEDPAGIERVSRPLFTLNPQWTDCRDCDDKATAMLCWCNMQGIRSRIIVCGLGKKPHHVYNEVWLGGRFIPVDATYPERSIFGKLLYTEDFREVFE